MMPTPGSMTPQMLFNISIRQKGEHHSTCVNDVSCPRAILWGAAREGARCFDDDNFMLYELYDAHPNPDGSWDAGSGAVFELGSH